MRILYEDNHLLIVNKRAGQLSQGDKTSDETIAEHYKAYLKEKYEKPGNVFLHPVHRLDRPVSGCLIMARTSKALSRLTAAFREGKVKKHYLAISSHRSQEKQGRLENYLLKDSRRNSVRVVQGDPAARYDRGSQSKSAKGLPPSLPRAKYAELDYALIPHSKSFKKPPPNPLKRGRDELHLYHVRPKTGRSHQIRVQLSHAGMPILGDVKYGGTKWPYSKAIALHCYAMEFQHPTQKEQMVIQCLPDQNEYWQVFSEMKSSISLG